MPPPIRKGWRESADKTPQHNYDILLTDYYKPRIQAGMVAFGESLPISRVVAAFSHRLYKATMTAAQLKAATDKLFPQVRELLGDSGTTQQLETTVLQLISEGWLTGMVAAAEQLGAASLTASTPLEELATSTNWDTWKPGDTAGAAELADGGLQKLIDNASFDTIQSIKDNALDRVGNLIAAGVAAGDNEKTIADAIRDSLDAPWRAEMIAHTEASRAIHAATLDRYREAGVTKFILVLSDDACEECQLAFDDGTPIALDDEASTPPIHPFCRCTVEADLSELVPAEEMTPDELAAMEEATVAEETPAATEEAPSALAGLAEQAATAVASNLLERFAPSVYADLPSISAADAAVVEAAQKYAGSAYRLMNGLLRGDEDLYFETVAAKYELKAQAATLEAALNEQILSEDVILGRSQRTGASIFTEEMLSNPDAAIGHVYTSSGFTSTFTGDSPASFFSSPKAADVGLSFRMDILAPAGTRGATILNPGEAEFVLPPGTEMTVVGHYTSESGQRVYQMLITGQQ